MRVLRNIKLVMCHNIESSFRLDSGDRCYIITTDHNTESVKFAIVDCPNEPDLVYRDLTIDALNIVEHDLWESPRGCYWIS